MLMGKRTWRKFVWSSKLQPVYCPLFLAQFSIIFTTLLIKSLKELRNKSMYKKNPKDINYERKSTGLNMGRNQSYNENLIVSQKNSTRTLNINSEQFCFGYLENDKDSTGFNRIVDFTIDFASFKVSPCPYMIKHNQKQCVYFHNFQDKRRPHFEFSIKMCPTLENGDQCIDGDDCKFSHNRVEQLYKPENYKTKFCFYYPKRIAECEYGKYCSFAHKDEEIMIPLLHQFEKDEHFFMLFYKTIWCPFSSIKHNRGLCVYAHNWQDFRRKPNDFSYQPQPCQYWNSTKFITNYDDCCPQKIDCTMCHGWKEIEYHPMTYKTKPCMNKSKCKRDNQCPYFHSEMDKRAKPDKSILALRERHPLSMNNIEQMGGKNGEMKGFIDKLFEEEEEALLNENNKINEYEGFLRSINDTEKLEEVFDMVKISWMKDNLFTGAGVK